jgi:ferrochelatase
MINDTPVSANSNTVPSEAARAPGSRIGVLLVNLGTPDAATPEGVRTYLAEFLSDPRVIEKDTALWRFVLNNIILRFRPRIKARDYQKIWNKEKNESPLKTITYAQAQKLSNALADVDPRLGVDWAMRYGNPSIRSGIDALVSQGCERLLIIPLYPQYSAATTATVCDEAFRRLMRLRRQPTLRVAAPYYDDPVYIDALATSLQAELAKLDFDPEVIVASFHGMPKEYVQKGDPYERQCIRTTELLRERLGLAPDKLLLTFQSRFGRDEWLQPYTDATIRKLAKQGVKRVAVITPGFSADCLETLEEIAVENAHVFKKARGEKFAAIPCLNDSPEGMRVIRHLALRELAGWIDAAPGLQPIAIETTEPAMETPEPTGVTAGIVDAALAAGPPAEASPAAVPASETAAVPSGGSGVPAAGGEAVAPASDRGQDAVRSGDGGPPAGVTASGEPGAQQVVQVDDADRPAAVADHQRRDLG